MPIENIEHPGYREVGRRMRDVVEKYHGDAAYLKRLSADQMFDLVEGIHYEYDRDVFGVGDEGLARPARFNELPGLDCKKKAIFIACWARCRGLRYRFVAVDDTGGGVSHVFCEVEDFPGHWLSMDATIPGLFRPGSPMPNVRFREVI